MQKIMRAASVVCGLLVCSFSARADETPVQLSPVQVTANRGQESQFVAPQPLTVLSEAELEVKSPQVLTEFLRGQPGAFFQQTGPGQGIVIVRGLKGAEVLHLVDGFRLNNAFFRTAPSQYIALVDPYNISQLELLRGPYATLYGSDAMGGVLQLLTPEHRFAGDTPELMGGARVQYNSQDLSRVARVWGATGYKNFSVSAGVTTADYGSRKLAEPGQSPDGQGTFPLALAERVNDTAYRSRGIDLKTIFTLSDDDELMFSLQNFDLPGLPRYNETVSGYGTANGGRQAVAVSIYRNDRSFYHLRYRHSAPLAFMDSLELHLGHQVINDNRLDRERDLSRDTFEFNQSALTGLTAQARSQRGVHGLLYGVELYSDRVNSRSVRETPPGRGSQVGNSAAGFQSRFPSGARADDYGVYLSDEWQIAEGWLLDFGGRYSYHQTDLPQADRALAAKTADSDVTGNLALRYAITPALGWTVNAGRGFRAPNINDLAQVGRRSGGRIVVANLDLKPESVNSLDTGFKFSDGGWSGEAGIFYSDYQDRITLVNNAVAEGSGGCPDDGDAVAEPCAQNRNIAKARYYGFEGGIRTLMAGWLTLEGTLNYTWADQESNGVKSPGNRVPPLNGQVATRLRPLPTLSVVPSVFFAGAQNRLDDTDKTDNRINPKGTPGYAIVNLQTIYDLSPNWAVQIEGRNLFNSAYREHGSGIDGAARGVVFSARSEFK